MGVVKALTSVGASEVLSQGRVPYYCIVAGNVRSMRRALAAGFFPPWVDICTTLDAALRVSERSLGSGLPGPRKRRVYDLSGGGAKRHRSGYAFPILNTLVPQVGHVPWVAGLPFFMVICVGLLISLEARHFMQ